MKIRYKLIIVLLFVSLSPLSLVGISAVNISKREVIENIGVTQYKKVENISNFIDWYFLNLSSGFALAMTTFDIKSLSSEEITGFLRLLFHQFPSLLFITFMDEKGGNVVEPVYLSSDDEDILPEAFKGRAISSTFLKRIEEAKNIKLKDSGRRTLIGDLLIDNEGGGYALPLITLPQGKDNPGDEIYTMYSIVSLREVQRYLADFTLSDEEVVAVLDSEFNPFLIRTSFETKGMTKIRRTIKDMVSHFDFIDPIKRGRTGGIVNFKSMKDIWMGSFKKVESIPWTVILMKSGKEVFRPVNEIRKRSIFWIGVCIFLSATYGFYFAGTLSKPLLKVRDGAREIKSGNLEKKIEIKSKDEIGELAKSFNEMAEELKERNEEILRWNLELQKRVQERTKELEETQADLLSAQRMAVFAELGSSLAHEMNNPLTAIIGMSQLLLHRKDLDKKIKESIETIKEEAIRSSETVQKLLSFSSGERRDGLTEPEIVDLKGVIEEALFLFKGMAMSKNIGVETKFDTEHPCLLTSKHELEESFFQIVSGIFNISPQDGRVTISVSSHVGAIHVEFLLHQPPDIPIVVGQVEDQKRAKRLSFWLAEMNIRKLGGEWETIQDKNLIEKIVIKLKQPLPKT